MNASRELELMDRIVLGDAPEQAWREWIDWADQHPEAWRHLAMAQRDQSLLTELMQNQANVADGVDLPFDHTAEEEETDRAIPFVQTMARIPMDGAAPHHHTPSRAWSGLAVAALVLLVLTITQFLPGTADNSGSQAGVSLTSGPTNASDAFQEYLKRGRDEGLVVNEVPTRLLLDTQPNPDGDGFRVLYVRQIIEVVDVPELYFNNGTDETGQPMFVQYDQPARRSY